ncbi:MAG: DUF2130 domain-containing protein [Bacteroidia bacterium]
MSKTTQITCPKCGNEFNVEDVLAHQIEEKYRNELNSKITEIEGEYKKKESFLSQKEQELKQKSTDIDVQVAEKLKVESEKKSKEIKKQVEQEFEDRIKTLSEETTEAKKEVQGLKNTKIENEQLKRKMEEQRQNLEIEFEQKMTQQLKDKTTDISKRETEKNELKLKELHEVIDSMKNQMDEMKRKAEQGDMRLQGEVQELALEEILRSLFPFDSIEEVGKGIKGADVIHTVKNKLGNDCGKILYESKRTRAFSNDWISKLKNDAGLVKADVYVIVSEALPEGVESISQKDGVWICSFAAFKGLVIVLRESLLRISEAYAGQTNKGEKMQMLYDYLLSNEFKLQIGAIIEGFTSLQDSYVKEKRAMERIWKEREKQLEKVLLNTNHFIGSIKGIAGSSLPDLKQIGSSDNLLEFEK